MSLKKVSAVALSAAMLVSMAACSGTASSSAASSTAPAASSTAPAASSAASEAPAEFSYPVEGNPVVSYWVGVSLSKYNDNNDNLPLYQKLQENTGIDIDFVHPTVGQEQENFNLMLASGEYPDIIEAKYLPAASLLEDEIIIELSDLLPEYAPNLWSFLQSNPDIDRQCKNDDSQYLLFPFIRPDPLLQVSSGPMVRADWLEKLGMDPDEVDTIAEWDVMLKGFKEQCGAEYPFSVESSGMLDRIMYAWETQADFSNENGTVEYGYLRPGYKDYLIKMNEWYTTGLLDPNFPSNSKDILRSNILTGKSGVCYGSGGSYLGVWLAAASESHDPENFDLTGLKYPTLEEGAVNKHGLNVQFEFSDSNGWAMVSTQCENVEMACRLLDYGYSEDGLMLYNFGIEGESYTMVDGVPTYTEAMFDTSTGKSVSDNLGYYVRATGSGPFIQDPGYIMQYYSTQQQKDALGRWSAQEQKSTKMPAIVHTTDEATEVTEILADIKTYIAEEQFKFISGSKSFDEFDAFIDQIKKMDIDRAIEIKQGALDRFNAR